jgi:DNA-binding Lrp family transcriptional regulator
MSTKGVSIGVTKLRILRESAVSESRWSKLVKSTGVSEKVLSEHLRDLQKAGLLTRSTTGYIATGKGLEVLKEVTFAEDMRKQKLAKKLLIGQKLASPKDPFTFESLGVLLFDHEPLSRTRYQAQSVIEALDVTSDRELDADTRFRVYAAAVRMVAAALASERRAKLTVTIDLEKGFDIVEKQLEEEINRERNDTKRKKLEAIHQQFRERRDANIEETRKRFLSW